MRRNRLAASVASVLMLGSAVGAIGVATASSGDAVTSCTANFGYFTPTRAVVSNGIGSVHVLSVGLTRTGQMGAPPKTSTGLHEFGWYAKGYPPGYGSGGVAMDAHVYFPNGTLRSYQGGLALGNALLLHVYRGSTITLYNSTGSHHVCYRVSSRVVYAPSRVPMNAIVYGHAGGQQLGVIVCSGRRLSNGDYTSRTVFYAQAARP